MASPGANSAQKKRKLLQKTASRPKRSALLSTPAYKASDVRETAVLRFPSSEEDLCKTMQFRQDCSVGRLLGKGGQGTVFLCTRKTSRSALLGTPAYKASHVHETAAQFQSDKEDLCKTTQFRQDYSVGRLLGKGGQGTVFLCTHKTSGKKFACKSVYKSDLSLVPDAERNLKQEISALSTLRGHPHVISLEALYEEPDAFYLVTELCPQGTLTDHICRCNDGGFTEDDAASIFHDVLCTLTFMHLECGIMHRDLKAENVYLTSDGTVKLGDFGYATTFQEGCILVDAVGSPLYMAPEMMMRQGYDERCDVWSLGVLLYNMLSAGKVPFLGDCVDEIYDEILQDEYPLEELQISPNAQNLVRSLLSQDLNRRPTLEQVSQHPWLHSTRGRLD